MAWEARGRGGRYYYRSVRVGDRVKKEYLGTGEIAKALVRTDEVLRRARAAERAERAEELARLEALAAPVLRLDEDAGALLRAALVAGGFHRRKGEWRRGRGA